MHWRTSKSNRRYLYRNVRQGDRVVSQYVGTGQVADFTHRSDALRRAEQQAQADAWEQETQRYDELNATVKELCALVEQLLMAELLLAGYHRHQWSWRKRRVKRSLDQTA